MLPVTALDSLDPRVYGVIVVSRHRRGLLLPGLAGLETAEQQIGVIAYSPMASGLLTGKYTRATVDAIAVDDWRRKFSVHFREPALTANLAVVEKLEQIARRVDRNLAELAVAWVLRRSEITAAIVGARRPSQIEQTASASDWQLPAEVVNEIEDLLAARETQLVSQPGAV